MQTSLFRTGAKSLLARILPQANLEALKSFEFRLRHRLGIPYEAEAKFLATEGVRRGWIRAGSTVLDVGSNIGQYAALFSQLVGEDGCVHSFEPMPHVRAALHRNLAKLRCRNVTVHPVGASESAGSFDLYTPLNDGRPMFQESSLQRRAPSDVVTTVRTVRLDDIDIGPCSFAKFDIEGAELLALRGAEELLGGHRPVLMLELERDFCRRFGYEPTDIGDTLAKFGYAPFRLTNGTMAGMQRQELENSFGNVFFLPPTAM